MTATIGTYDLAHIVEAVAPAVSRTPLQNPTLTTIRLTAANGIISARATDLDMALGATAPATGDIDVCIPAGIFTKSVKVLPGGRTTITTDGIDATLESDGTTFVLPTVDVKGWPTLSAACPQWH